jgi:transmembrane sensor
MTKAHDDRFRTADQIEQEAARWVVMADEHNTPDYWSRLDTWLASNPRHRAAFLRLSVAWRRADQLKKLAALSGEVDENLLDPARWTASEEAQVEALVPPPPPASKPAIPRWRWRLALPVFSMRFAGAAAALVLAGVLSVGAWLMFDAASVHTYATELGEFRRVTLSDGSLVALNTNSEIAVRYSRRHREVELVRGEALFTVAHDTSRPFDVSAGRTTVRAVGTEFAVRLRDETAIDVVVSEGRIVIDPPSSTTLAAGTAAAVRNGILNSKVLTASDITRMLAWTTGRLVFQSATLASMADEFNRYNSERLLISDPELAKQRFGGNFRATDPSGFAAALERTYDIKVKHLPGPNGTEVIRLDKGGP